MLLYFRKVETVFFVYDHSMLKKEEDDLKDAILYFYPEDVNVFFYYYLVYSIVKCRVLNTTCIKSFVLIDNFFISDFFISVGSFKGVVLVQCLHIFLLIQNLWFN